MVKRKVYCQSLPSKNDKDLQLSHFFDNLPGLFWQDAPPCPKKTGSGQKFFACAPERRGVFCSPWTERAGVQGKSFVHIAADFFFHARGARLPSNPRYISPRRDRGSRGGGGKERGLQLLRTGRGREKIPAGRGEAVPNAWRSWHGTCWLLRHPAAERPAEALCKGGETH